MDVFVYVLKFLIVFFIKWLIIINRIFFLNFIRILNLGKRGVINFINLVEDF